MSFSVNLRNVGLRLRSGPHPTTVEDVENYVDFLDVVFQRSSRKVADPIFVFGYTFENWIAASGETQLSKPDNDRLMWAIGQEAPQVYFPSNRADARMVSAGWMELLYGRPISSTRMKVIPMPFGVDLKADLYLPLTFQGKLPLVIWLHPFSPTARVIHGMRKLRFEELTRRGICGPCIRSDWFGTRVEHAKNSLIGILTGLLLGKMAR